MQTLVPFPAQSAVRRWGSAAERPAFPSKHYASSCLLSLRFPGRHVGLSSVVAGLPQLGIRPRQQALASWRNFALQGTPQTIVKWIFQPVGDGDCKHLSEDVALPSSFELLSDAITVGRVADKADVVLGIATVSGLHARLERRGNVLYITDMDSTNGTYVNETRVRPGASVPVPPGSFITFGDQHLAIFRYLQVEEEAQTAEQSQE